MKKNLRIGCEDKLKLEFHSLACCCEIYKLFAGANVENSVIPNTRLQYQHAETFIILFYFIMINFAGLRRIVIESNK